MAERGKWRLQFAWWPVAISNTECAWLEYVEVRSTWTSNYGDSGWEHEFRAVPDCKGPSF